MKNLLSVSLLVLVGFISAQEYYFNRLIQYEQNGEEKIQILFNSENKDYFLFLNDSSEDVSADLFDKASKKIHTYTVKRPQEKNGLIYTYIYDSSDKLLKSKPNENLVYDFRTKRDDGYYRFTDLRIYEGENEAQPIISADLTLRYTHESKFEIFNLCCLLGADYFELLRPDDKFVVVQAKITDRLNQTHDYKLISEQVIQFNLKAPEKRK